MKETLTVIMLLVAIVFAYAQPGVSHEEYDQILKKYVNDSGMVNYKGLAKERFQLQNYLSHLENNPPKANWDEYEKLAYWINAYNAFTLELILEHYPIKSIKDIGSSIQIPFINTPWDIKFIQIGDENYDLNNLEHGIIRKEFNEPRIHFALVCAAISCPKLQNWAYLPEELDKQLTIAAKEFLSDGSKNTIKNSNEAEISKIFSWYRGDFTKRTSLTEYLNQFVEIDLNESAKIGYKNYDWGLNEQ